MSHPSQTFQHYFVLLIKEPTDKTFREWFRYKTFEEAVEEYVRFKLSGPEDEVMIDEVEEIHGIIDPDYIQEYIDSKKAKS